MKTLLLVICLLQLTTIDSVIISQENDFRSIQPYEINKSGASNNFDISNISGIWDLTAFFPPVSCEWNGFVEIFQNNNLIIGFGILNLVNGNCQPILAGDIDGIITGNLIEFGMGIGGTDSVNFTGTLNEELDSMWGTWQIPNTSIQGTWYATKNTVQNLEIISPVKGDKWIAGEKDTIKWTGGLEGQFFSIEYSADSGKTYNLINIAAPADSGYYIWELPDDILTTKAKIKLTDHLDPEIFIESDLFRIKPYILTRIDENGNYYEYRKERDQWDFVNIEKHLWPPEWWQQFDYKTLDLFTGHMYNQWIADSAFNKANSSDHPDWISWVNTFTTHACYLNSFFGFYNPIAILKWKAVKVKWGGSCFAVAVTNALAFSYKDQFISKFPNFPQFVYPTFVSSDDNVRKVISEIYAQVYGERFIINTLNKWNSTPNTFLDDIKTVLIEDNCETRTLYFANNNGDGAHEVLVYGLERDKINPSIYNIKIYDSAYPDSKNPITLNTDANNGNGTWHTPDWINQLSGLPWGGNGFIFLDLPADWFLQTVNFYENSESIFSLSDTLLVINTRETYKECIIDELGRKLGYFGSSFLQEIPGAYPHIAPTGSETPPYGYSLQTDDYSVILSDFEEETVETFFFTDNKSFVYERSAAGKTQTDRLFFDGGVSVTNPDPETKTIKLINLMNENTQEKFTVVRGINLVQNDSVKIVNPDDETIKLISYGSAKEYGLEINFVSETALDRFVEFNINLPANSSHIYVPDWSDITNTQLMILVDIGNNGTIDDTLHLNNTVDVEDQGSLLTPDNYNLAQNYPNPFNPTTTISWQSPVGSWQTLKVYDLLGREVATLVNEYKPAGSYEVEFDASNLSSGVYLYKLTTGEFTNTKKLMILK